MCVTPVRDTDRLAHPVIDPLFSAQTADAQILAQGGGEAGGGGEIFMLILLGIMVLFMVMTFRRGKKMRDAQAAAVSGAVVGAEVMTAGGMIGTVVARDEERQRITLEFSSGDRADFQVGAGQHVIKPAVTPQDPTSEGPAAEEK